MVADSIVGTIALGLLLVPGTLVAAAYGLRLPWVAGFISGTVALVLIAPAFDAVGIGLTASSLLTTWAATSIGALWLWRRASRQTAAPPVPKLATEHEGLGWILLLLPAIAAVAFRAMMHPLSGVDTVFRWGYLAEMLFEYHTLAFYPPVAAADYRVYAWPDGIPPAVSLLYFWSFLVAGAPRPGITGPIVVFQLIAILATTRALARRYGGESAARLAGALVAGSALVLWGVTMGQESGLLTLSVLALLLYLPDSDSRGLAPTAFAGLAAALGALTREYFLVLPLIGTGIALGRRMPSCHLRIFAVTAFGAIATWYVRTWLRTGNPVFNLRVGELFPVNEAHARLMDAYRPAFGWESVSWPAAAQFLVLCAPLLALGLAGLALVGSRPHTPRVALVTTAMAVVALWVISLPYTAAGFTYSLRVLAPALTLAAVLAGLGFARWSRGRVARFGLPMVAAILAADAAARSLVLPSSPYRHPPSKWSSIGGVSNAYHARPIYRQLANTFAGHRAIVLGPNALLNRQGAATVPFWSPEVSFLWRTDLAPKEIAATLHAAQMRWVLLTLSPLNHRYLSEMAFFRTGTADALLHPVWADEHMALYKIRAPEELGAP